VVVLDAESIGEWLSLWRCAGRRVHAGVLLYPAIVLAVIVLGSIPRETAQGAKAARPPRNG
jgi:hypothetical protein